MHASKLCLLVLLVSQAFAFEKYLAEVANAAAGDQGVPEAQWFVQRLDHFNHQETRTWEQRYFMNDSFWDPSNEFHGPIFVQIGGEGPISGAYVTVLQMVDYAQRYGALVLALEHRFYGESYPLPDLSTDNLQYLSSQQALADVAEFITYIKNFLGAYKSPVVTFGCSYPGNLAAWFRMNYPTVTIASVASSSPVQATFDFYQYLDVVNTSLADVTGEECDTRIQQATDAIQGMLQTEAGRIQLEQMFNTCENISSKLDVATMMASLMGNFQGVVQYNDENGNPVDIKYLCGIMTNTSQDALTSYIQINNFFVQQTGASCFDISYENQVNELANTTTTAGIASGRSWVYQTCTQFGYFQTTDSDNQPFGDLVPASYYARLCEDAFGIDPTTIQPNIDETNVLYGGQDIPATGPTNIMFVNGNIDPWHSLGITEDISDSLRAVFIDGTAHCANVLPATPNDLPSLVEAREQIAVQIGAWLLQAIHKN